MPCPDEPEYQTLDLDVFQYKDFLDFLVSTVQEKSVGVGTLNGYRSAVKSLYIDRGKTLPHEFIEDMKVIFSGI